METMTHMAAMRHMETVAVMQARQMQMKQPAQGRNDAECEAHQKADQIDVRPGHTVCPFNTCSSRSDKPGVSRIAASRTKHRRECSWRATFSIALHNSGSERNVSAPSISQRSNRSSVTRTSDISFV